jgi:hypothetical protein
VYAGAFFDYSIVLPAAWSDEVSVPVKAGSGIELPDFIADEVSVPVKAGAGIDKTIVLPPVSTDEVSVPVKTGAGIELPASIADEVLVPVKAGVGTEFILDQYPSIANPSTPSMFGTSSLGTTAQELFRTSHQLIPGQPESVVLGSLQPLSLLTVEELMHPDPHLPSLFKAPTVTALESLHSFEVLPPICMFIENTEMTVLTKSTASSKDNASVSSYKIPPPESSRHESPYLTRPPKTVFNLPSYLSNGSLACPSVASSSGSRWRRQRKRSATSISTESVSSFPNRKSRRMEARRHLQVQNSETQTVLTKPSILEINEEVPSKVTPTKHTQRSHTDEAASELSWEEEDDNDYSSIQETQEMKSVFKVGHPSNGHAEMDLDSSPLAIDNHILDSHELNDQVTVQTSTSDADEIDVTPSSNEILRYGNFNQDRREKPT